MVICCGLTAACYHFHRGTAGGAVGTTIVIAHRLATVRRADVIFVIDGGTIAERGTHEKLLATGGLYSHLYDIQFQRQSELICGSFKLFRSWKL